MCAQHLPLNRPALRPYMDPYETLPRLAWDMVPKINNDVDDIRGQKPWLTCGGGAFAGLASNASAPMSPRQQ